MARTTLFFLAAMALAVCVNASGSGEPRGAANMVLPGGRFGDIPFPHKRHQAVLPKCTGCHDMFPKAPGAIASLKAQGKLARRQVMGLCTSCHFDRARRDQKAGPTRCGGCHKG